jgi:putative GTP pyrophosphokinase
MSFRYYYADRIRERMPEFKGTDEELQRAIDDISLQYNSAIRVLETRLKNISDDFDKQHSYMPIHHEHSRLKNFDSIIEKAARYGIEDPINNLDTVKREILDIAGIRVVCNYEEDLAILSDLLLDQEDVEVIRVKDYCDRPKESGYRSLHVVVAVPVYLVHTKKMVPVEIQFRSVAMDAWASLEHELRYKHKGDLDPEIVDTLKSCAEDLHRIDETMSRVRHKVLDSGNKYNEI